MEREKQPLPAIYAVRVEGKEGWKIYNPPVLKDKIVAHLEGEGLKGLEFVEIFTLLGKGSKDSDVVELECMTFPDSLITGKAWMYDSQSDCWRAPGEIYPEPDKQAVVANSFRIDSDPPEVGWWDIGFIINGKGYWISSSEVYDPLLDYHNLMLAVVRGQNIRITVDEEGSCTDISIYCKTDGIIRFILKQLETKEPKEVDVLVDGVKFVQSLYARMCDLFGDSKTFEEQWLGESEDHYDADDIKECREFIEEIKQERGYPSYPDEEIEKYLAANATQ